MSAEQNEPDGADRSFRKIFATNPAALDIPWTESPFFDTLFEAIRPQLSEHQAERVSAFARDGYLILDLDLEDFEERTERIIHALSPLYPKGNRRVAEAWYFQNDVRALASSPQVLDILRLLYRREPIPFQTLNFETGTQQATHSDTVHFHSAPSRFMCGVWIALEDVDAHNGPLHYYPGSHLLPDYSLGDLVIPPGHNAYEVYEMFVDTLLPAKGFSRKELSLRKGQAIIWAANLFHGGCPILSPSRTRHSQVTHYYFDECLYYVPVSSRLHVGEACLREVIDIRSMQFVNSKYKGETIDLDAQKLVWRYPRPLPVDTVASAHLEPKRT